MNKRPIIATATLLTLLFIMIQILPTFAWNYTDGVTADDSNIELFGPRANNLLINLYFDAETEWDSLEAGEIDVTDWALTETYYNRFTTPPQDADILAKFYGGEFGIFLLDINNNNREFLGNPEDPAYPNAVGGKNPWSTVEARQAVFHLHDKPNWLPVIVGTGFYEDMYTTHPSAYGSFSLATGNPYPYNPAAAAALFDSVNVIYDPGQHPYRFYDLNDNDVYDGGDEELIVQWAIRSDHYHRNALGDAVADEMEALNFQTERFYGPSVVLGDYWFYGKTAHFYTAGWNLGVEPDHVILWLSDFYWHPGFCYNTGYVDDAQLDTYAYATWLANTEPEALTNCLAFQQRMIDIAGCVPWFTYAGSKGVRRRYTGGSNEVPTGDAEDKYRGDYWDGVVDFPGYGLDSFMSFMNMHPRGDPKGLENLDQPGGGPGQTIRWGFKTDSLTSFNPVYSEWLWEWNVLGLIHDTLLIRNPYSALELIPWMCADYETTTYVHPVYGDTTKVSFSLRPDVHFADGTPMTAADIYFTWVELAPTLLGRGLPPPWWYSSVQHILSFTIFDAYNFECLLDVKSVYATMWIGGMVILPKHIWLPMAEGTSGDVQASAADPDMIGIGPYRFVEYVAASHILMAANEPGKTVTSNHAGGSAKTSPTGYCRYFPVYAETYVKFPVEYERRAKIPYGLEVEMRSEFTNLVQETRQINTTIEIDDTPIFTASEDVPYNEQALWVSLLFAAIQYDYGYSWYHKEADLGILDIWSWNKVLYINTVTLLIVDINGDPIYTHYTIGWVKIDIHRHFVTFSYPYPVSTHIMSDYEFSWHTLIVDISGGTYYDQVHAMIRPELVAAGLYAYDFAAYPHKTQLVTPDIKVDIKDVALAAKGFGAYPGHERWSAVADTNGDYKIDIKDIASIAKDFGWVG